jgi:hypothetical protein
MSFDLLAKILSLLYKWVAAQPMIKVSVMDVTALRMI